MKHIYEFLVFLVLGLWLMSSPYTLGFTDTPGAYWNAILVGIFLTVSSAVGLYADWGEFSGRPGLHKV